MLIVVSDTIIRKGEANIANALLDEGLAVFHLRKPSATASELQQIVEKIKLEHLRKIALHSHHQLASIYGMNRLHYPEMQRESSAEKEWQAMKESGYRLSTSIHGLNEAEHLSPCFNYAFFGPVFNSISKKDYSTMITKDFRLPQTKTKLVAIGGIKESNVSDAFQMGFAGVAVLGAVWQSGDPVKSFQQIKKACNLTAR